VLLLDATDLPAAIDAAGHARRSGVPVVVDVDQARQGVAALIEHADVVIASAGFPVALTGAVSVEAGLAEIAHAGPWLAVATLGEQGSVAVSRGRVIRTPAISVEVVDTTGAGDAFRAGFIAGWLRQPGAADLEVLLRQANAAAGLSCRGLGAQGSLPSWDEVASRV
jgi:sugar/nucleoside kinase (ribokinase family)